MYLNFLTNGKNGNFLYFTYFLSVEYSIINILRFNVFRVPTNSSIYSKTDRFHAQASQIYTKMVTQGRTKANILRQIKINIPRIH